MHDDHGHDQDRGQNHIHDEHCGHAHGPEPSELAGPGGWRRGFGAIFAVGISPVPAPSWFWCSRWRRGCSGGVAATFVMGLGTALTVATIAVIAVSAKNLAQRLSGAGDGGGALIMRGLEFAAAGLVLLFGIGLLLGYVAAERVTCL